MRNLDYVFTGEKGYHEKSRLKMDSYKVPVSGGNAEIVEKKSRFIATVRKCETEAQAVSFIEEMKKKYWDARHNCYAYVIGANAEITRCSDDGEPSGTAGRPMLEALLGEEIRNVAVVVTRYFGGVLLGTGGLVRAYSQAVKEGLAGAGVGVVTAGVELRINVDYNDIGKVLHIIEKRGLNPKESNYAETVSLTVVIAQMKADKFLKEITDITGGRAKIEQTGAVELIE